MNHDLGAIMEQGSADQVSAPPHHPDTEALLSAVSSPAFGCTKSSD